MEIKQMSTSGWIDKQTVAYTYIMEYYSALKCKEVYWYMLQLR